MMTTRSMPPGTAMKRIPYGLADYGRMRQDNSYYVDKTRFIPLLEAQPYFLFLIRPRRFGKSLWLSVLQHYYDINRKADFAALFSGTYIGDHPTAERNSYLTMFLNFALVNPELDKVAASFEDNGRAVVEDFLIRYQPYFDAEQTRMILALPTLEAQLRRIFFHAEREKLKVYLLIDEYDNFANTILATAGQQAYHDLTHGHGFFRHFFNLLKGATGGQISGLGRLMITGVSPITLDDVSSGFNIGKNLSLSPLVPEMIGFTEDEVRTMLTYYHEVGALPLAVDACLALMGEWYNHYHFERRATTPMFNSDMVLYFVSQVIDQQRLPDEMIDQNVRIDYTKLRHLMMVEKQLNGNFSQLRTIINSGEVLASVNTSFPLSRLHERDNFISLLYYFGLLTFAGEESGQTQLRIPNQTIKELMYSYLRDGLQDADIFRLDLVRLGNLLAGMAYRGEWQAFFAFITGEIQKQTSVRDYLNGEKMIQGFLLAYLNIAHFFLTWSEKELGGGFVDFYLEPFLARYPDMRYGYLIELKYIPRSEFNATHLTEKVAEAEAQLARYADDARLQPVAGKVALKKLAFVYSGWELVYQQEWSPEK
jgi:hypothetical protein